MTAIEAPSPPGGAGEPTDNGDIVENDLQPDSSPGPQHGLAHWLTSAASAIVGHQDFEAAVLLAVAGNCITLAAYDPLLPDHQGRNGGLFWAGKSWVGR